MSTHTHERIRAWITHRYPRPAIDREWLAECSDWVVAEHNLDPTRNFDQFIQHVEAQLLQSNLADSTVHRTGIDPLLVTQNPNQRPPRSSGLRRPARPTNRPKPTTGPTPLLVEIKSITEIAHSAFSLLNTLQTRLDRADLGLAQGDDANPEANQPEEEEGPVPKFPRGMLRFELSDGSTTFRAIEFRPLPQLVLGETPLGYKMILQSTPIRNGIAFLEPSNVTLKGYRTEDHDIHNEQVFLSALRRRLGRPDPPPEAPAAQPQINVQAAPHPRPAQAMHAQAARPHHAPPAARPRPPSPPPDLDDMYVDDIDPDVLHELEIEMDKEIERQKIQPKQRTGVLPGPKLAVHPPFVKLPPMPREKTILNSNPKRTFGSNTTTASSSSLNPPSTYSTLKTSPYFAARTSETKAVPDIGLSPLPAPLPKKELDTKLESSNPPIKKLASTSTTPSAAKSVLQSGKRSPSPDSYDNLSFDMDVDESFFEQVGRIEQGALGASSSDKGKGKSKATGAEGTHASAAPGKRTPSKSGLGTRSRSLHLVSPSRAEPATRGTGASSLSSSAEFRMPPSTQPSRRRPPRDPSLIFISSSEDEADRNDDSGNRPLDLARRCAHNASEEGENEDSDVIDISD